MLIHTDRMFDYKSHLVVWLYIRNDDEIYILPEYVKSIIF